jgi:hypothetical protein
MRITRVMEATSANKDTHTHKAYKMAYAHVMDEHMAERRPNHVVMDLFARTCPWGDIRNDLNPEYLKTGQTNMNRDALELASEWQTSSVDVILFDPPFSSRQDADKYGGDLDASLWTNPKYMSDLGKEMYRILEPGGYVIKCGYNSNAPDNRFTFVKGYLSYYGGCRQDVIFTIWKKNDTTLAQYFD